MQPITFIDEATGESLFGDAEAEYAVAPVVGQDVEIVRRESGGEIVFKRNFIVSAVKPRYEWRAGSYRDGRNPMESFSLVVWLRAADGPVMPEAAESGEPPPDRFGDTLRMPLPVARPWSRPRGFEQGAPKEDTGPALEPSGLELLKAMQVLALGPEDVLVVSCEGYLTAAQCDKIREQTKLAGIENRVLVIAGEFALGVLRKEG